MVARANGHDRISCSEVRVIVEAVARASRVMCARDSSHRAGTEEERAGTEEEEEEDPPRGASHTLRSVPLRRLVRCAMRERARE